MTLETCHPQSGSVPPLPRRAGREAALSLPRDANNQRFNVPKSLRKLLEAYQTDDDKDREELLGRIADLLLPVVRRFMSTRLRLDRESIDVCQSLLLDFHKRAKQGQIEMESEAALRGYIRTMVRHKLANLSDKMNTAKRGGGKQGSSLESSEPSAPSFAASPSVLAYAAEIHGLLTGELSEEERAIFDGRLEGRTNQEIAESLEKSPDAVRMIWNRARTRLTEHGVLETLDDAEPMPPS